MTVAVKSQRIALQYVKHYLVRNSRDLSRFKSAEFVCGTILPYGTHRCGSPVPSGSLRWTSQLEVILIQGVPSAQYKDDCNRMRALPGHIRLYERKYIRRSGTNG